MNKFSLMTVSHKKISAIFLSFLLGLGTFFFCPPYRNNKPKYQYDAHRYIPVNEELSLNIQGPRQYENTKGKQTDLILPEPSGVTFPFSDPNKSTDSREDSRPFEEVTDKVQKSNLFYSPFPGQGEKFADIATYDPIRRGYYLKKVDTSDTPEVVSEGLAAVLQILDQKDVPSDFFRWDEYKKAYQIIDTLYSDVYIWEKLTNETARTNLFLYLFTKYSDDNKKWEPYKKDVSDCTQYSQRIYMFMEPGEVFIEDDYFQFLFPEEWHRQERNKLCNKIPTVLYTVLDPYILKEEDDIAGHAMISFAPDNRLDQIILGEPQTGDFCYIEKDTGYEDIGYLVNEKFTQSNNMFHFGKIIDIEDDPKHEANILLEGGYFFPKSLSDEDNARDELKGNDDDKPILLSPQDCYVCGLFSSYIGQTLSDQSANWSDFLYVLGNTVGQEHLSQDQTKEMMNTTLDIISYSLNGLPSSDIKILQDNIFSFDSQYGGQDNPPQKEAIRDILFDFFYAL